MPKATAVPIDNMAGTVDRTPAGPRCVVQRPGSLTPRVLGQAGCGRCRLHLRVNTSPSLGAAGAGLGQFTQGQPPSKAPGDPASVWSALWQDWALGHAGGSHGGTCGLHVAVCPTSTPSSERPESACLPAVGLSPHQGVPRVPWSCQEALRKWGELARGSAGGGCPGWGRCLGVSACPVGGCLLLSCWPAVPAGRAPHPRWVPPPPLVAPTPRWVPPHPSCFLVHV